MSSKRVLLAVAALVVLTAVVLTIVVSRLGPRLRTEIVQALESRMDAEVTLERFEAHLWPRPGVSGGGLTIRKRDQPDRPPLVSIRHFSGNASWLGIFRARLNAVSLDSLEITIPPKKRQPAVARASMEQSAPTTSSVVPATFAIATLSATNARLTILPRNPEKDPRVFDIFTLEMEDLTLIGPSRFTASLTNPIPQGYIQTTGLFGPWNGEEPSETPVEGQFQFDADLGTIKGVAGALHSKGDFDGTIDRIAVSGTTETPDFRIPKLKAAALPLATRFDAVVDGTNGDVRLDPVEIRLGSSDFVARGDVIGTKGIKGKRVVLDVTTENARMEDILTFTVRTQPPAMTGQLALTTSFDLPQGDRDVIERLQLAGSMKISNGQFASDSVQGKVDALSRRGRGQPEDKTITGVPSTIASEFAMADGSIRLKNLTYSVDGATVRFDGVYALESGALDFAGTVLLDASISDTQTGFRHFLLTPFDALFRKGGAGTRIPIRVSGTVDKPEVGLDVSRTLKGR